MLLRPLLGKTLKNSHRIVGIQPRFHLLPHLIPSRTPSLSNYSTSLLKLESFPSLYLPYLILFQGSVTRLAVRFCPIPLQIGAALLDNCHFLESGICRLLCGSRSDRGVFRFAALVALSLVELPIVLIC